MRDRKFQMVLYQVGDGEALAAHLEKMAAKGWFLEKIGAWGYVYRRGEPKKVRYAVTYFPEASVFDGVPGDRQGTYIDYCAAAGWELVTSQAQTQIFRSERADPTPIETDEGAKLDAVHRTSKKTVLVSYGLLLACMGMNLWTNLQSFDRDPLACLSSNSKLASLLFLAFVILALVYFIVDYIVWYLRSRRSVQRGGACAKVNTRGRRAAQVGLLVVSTLYLLAMVMDAAQTGRMAITLYAVVSMAVLVGGCTFAVQYLRGQSRNRSAVGSWAVYTAVVVALAILYVVGNVAVITMLGNSGHWGRKPAEIYVSHGGMEWDIYRDDLPLTLEDLGCTVTEADHCSYRCKESRSILMTRRVYIQRPYNFKSDLPRLEYQILDIPWDWLRERIVERWVLYWGLRPVEDPRWDADQMYANFFHIGHKEGEPYDGGYVLLVKGDRVAQLEPGGKLPPDLYAGAWSWD